MSDDRILLSALVDHSTSPRILDIHLDDCENDACTGCDPQHLAEQLTGHARREALKAVGQRKADAWNAKHPVGTPVKAYSWVRPEHPAFDPTTVLITRTRSAAWPLGSGDPVVLVEGRSGGIVLEHIDVITVDEYRRFGQLAEQAHAFLDLDADSVCPFEGACRYPYLTPGGQP